jgi:Family of unknown function (DUF5686)/CarboxypepD_reg-like domain
MSPMKFIPCFIFFFVFGFSVLHTSAQKKLISGVVKDEHSEEGVPFASVQFKNTSTGRLTDSSGAFSFYLDQWPSDTIIITCVGYQPYLFTIHHFKDSALITIHLERGTFNEGVRVKVKVNKGLLLWRKIVQHKPENNRYRFDNFSYELYNKLEIDLKNLNFKKFARLKPFKPVEGLINQNIDSAEGVKYLPAYLTESLSDYYYQKDPKKRREIIKAANTNGIKNESMIKFLGGMDQVVNVYNNFIAVFDKQFVSPISDNGDQYYNYNVIDTQQMGNNRYYHFVFTPKRKGSNTFEGDCWVHAGTFAIQKMNLRLGKDANVNFLETLSLIQEYKLINDSVWFLAKDKFVVDVSPVGKQNPGFIGRKTTTYRHIVMNDESVTAELSKNKGLEEIVTIPGTNNKDKLFWDTSRHEVLSKQEAGVIKMIDTLINAPAFKKFTNTVYFLGVGYKNVGNYEIGPWYNWFTSNSWEGFRMRFDLGTNKYFNKKVWLHAYLAYGFGDKKFKGKAEFFYLPKKTYPRSYISGSYTNDLDYGQNYYGEITSDNIFALAIRKNNIPIKNIKSKELSFAFFKEVTPWMSNRITFTHTASFPLRNLLPKDSFNTNGSGSPLTSFEIAFRVRFAYLEKFLDGNYFRISLGSPYPIGEINISKGFRGVAKSNYDYTKVSVSVSDDFKIPPIGSISWFVYAGKTFGTLPYTLLDIAPGNELYYYNKYAFNMMNRYEFVHDQYAGINIEHNVGNGIFRFFPKLKLRQFWTAKALWASLSDANKALNFKQGNTFQTLNGKTYLEVGTGVDNIFRVFRVDFIWRLLPTSDIRETTKQFGVFGSFRLSF